MNKLLAEHFDCDCDARFSGAHTSKNYFGLVRFGDVRMLRMRPVSYLLFLDASDYIPYSSYYYHYIRHVDVESVQCASACVVIPYIDTQSGIGIGRGEMEDEREIICHSQFGC